MPLICSLGRAQKIVFTSCLFKLFLLHCIKRHSRCLIGRASRVSQAGCTGRPFCGSHSKNKRFFFPVLKIFSFFFFILEFIFIIRKFFLLSTLNDTQFSSRFFDIYHSFDFNFYGLHVIQRRSNRPLGRPPLLAAYQYAALRAVKAGLFFDFRRPGEVNRFPGKPEFQSRKSGSKKTLFIPQFLLPQMKSVFTLRSGHRPSRNNSKIFSPQFTAGRSQAQACPFGYNKIRSSFVMKSEIIFSPTS